MPRSLPPLNAVRAFEAAARLGAVGKAADELHVTHAAVSHQIKALEAWIGRPLFQRVGRGIAVNADGAALASVAGEALDALAARLAELKTREGGRSLTISAAPSIAYRWIVPRLPRFVDAHPEIDVRLNHSSQVTDFKRETIDVGIRHGRGGWRDVEAVRLLDGCAYPMASPALLERAGLDPAAHPLPPERIAGLSIQHEAAVDSLDLWRRWFAKAGVPGIAFGQGAVYDDSGALLTVAVAGHGAVLGRVALAQEELRAGLLVCLSDIPIAEEDGYYLVHDPARREDPAIAAFRDWVIGEAEAFQAAFAVVAG